MQFGLFFEVEVEQGACDEVIEPRRYHRANLKQPRTLPKRTTWRLKRGNRYAV